MSQDVHPREVDRDPVFPSRKLSREFRIGVFVFVDQYRGDKAPQHERREQGRHPVESKESARIVVYIYIFNREREREIVRRRQSSIVSIIFSFFEIILFSLPLSLFLFVVVVARASEAFKKKKKIFALRKKILRKAQRFFLVLRHQFHLRSPSQIQLLERRRRRISRVQKKNSLFFAQKRRKKRSSFIFRRFFGTESEERRERRARARKMISKPRIITSTKSNGKIIEKKKIISLTVFRRYQQKPICSCACGVRRSRLENNRRISFL